VTKILVCRSVTVPKIKKDGIALGPGGVTATVNRTSQQPIRARTTARARYLYFLHPLVYDGYATVRGSAWRATRDTDIGNSIRKSTPLPSSVRHMTPDRLRRRSGRGGAVAAADRFFRDGLEIGLYYGPVMDS
jgi:hypothetical protein